MNIANFWYTFGPVAVLIVIVLGLIVLAIKSFRFFLAIIMSFGVGFLWPMIIAWILRAIGLDVYKFSGASIPMPSDIFSLLTVAYYLFPAPFVTPLIISVWLYFGVFSKKLLKNIK